MSSGEPGVTGVPLVGWVSAGRCEQDPKWVHVSPVWSEGAAGTAFVVALEYPAEAAVEPGHACGVPAVLDPDPREVVLTQ